LNTETGEVFEKRYWPAIERYAEIVHLLPASADDHHRERGGLLFHGLEVGYLTLKSARASLYGKDMGERKQAGRERWMFACFIAGLCHDLGKVASDVEVQSGTGKPGSYWLPDTMSLLDWATKQGLTKYYSVCRKIIPKRRVSGHHVNRSKEHVI
jgi:conjugal transfer pilus assembly protein TraI